MKYIVDSAKPVNQVVADIQTIAGRHKFGVLHIHDLQATLQKKGFDFPNACQVIEICNPQNANDVLMENIELNMLLPCRVSVYSDHGKTKIGMILPTSLLLALSNSPKLKPIAKEVEDAIIAIIEESR